jgi:hypothetical protein
LSQTKTRSAIVHVASSKPTELVVGVTAQLIKPIKIPLWYPYIICSSVDHQFEDCPTKA